MLTTLVSFNYDNGAYPQARLLPGSDGNFYGTTTSGGGTNDYGTIFKMTPSGSLTTLFAFNYDTGNYVQAGLVQGGDGCLYGTTLEGGTNGYGTIFRISTNSTFTILHQFSDNTDGYNSTELAQGVDGKFYGATSYGGTNGSGTIFRITTNGTFTTLITFNYFDGSNPDGLIQGKDRSFYGITSSGGTNGNGTFFHMVIPLHPTIISQPSNLTNLLGSTATFAVEVDGAVPLGYQWRKSSINLTNGGNISGATSSTLTLSGLTQADGGSYSVVVSNSYGSAISSNATLVVLPSLPEALNATNLTWYTGGHADWYGQTETTHDGAHAGQSGILYDLESSWVETAVTGPGQLAFWWKVSSESDFDYLILSINGVAVAAISGETEWEQPSFNLGTGSQTLRWTYAKDVTVSLGQDSAWLDQVTFASQPMFRSVTRTDSTLTLSWSTEAGRLYQVQSTTNLAQAVWSDWGVARSATNSTMTVSDTIGPDPQRFYRVLLLP